MSTREDRQLKETTLKDGEWEITRSRNTSGWHSLSIRNKTYNLRIENEGETDKVLERAKELRDLLYEAINTVLELK